MGIVSVDLNNINFDGTNDDEDDPGTSIHTILLARHIKFEKLKAVKKDRNEELILVRWHSKKSWNFCISEDEKKKET